MKKLISSIMLALIALVAQAQILTPVKWKIKLDDKGGRTRERDRLYRHGGQRLAPV